MIGEILGSYKIVKKLGEGATGETYLAEHQETGQQVAAKVLFPPLSNSREALDHFFTEVRKSSQINHVGIADLFDCGVHRNGRAFLVMELLEGKTLTDALIELGSVSDVESLADIGWQLATLLAAAHQSQLVHGALKPDAIFLTFPPAQAPRPLVKLVDFGMAKFSLDVRHSQTGSLLGAPLYMSPEISRGLGDVDQRADVYSLGCMLFEMACGRPPFVREGKGELIIAHATEAPPSVASLEPSIPAAIDTLIGRMLTKHPATRPQSMGEVAMVLEKFFACPAPGASSVTPVVLPQAAANPPPGAAPAGPLPVLPIATAAAAAVPPAAPIPIPVIAPRRLEPTALLPPGAEPDLIPHPSSAGKPVAPQAWVARVRQRTAILDPPSAQARPLSNFPSRRHAIVSAAPDSESRWHRPALVSSPAAARPRSPLPISLPIVLATASILVAVASGILLVRGRRPAPAGAPTSPAVGPRPASLRDEAFRPPAQAEPSPAFLPPPAPLTALTTATGLAKDGSSRPPAGPKLGSVGKPTPGRKVPAPRW